MVPVKWTGEADEQNDEEVKSYFRWLENSRKSV